MSRRRDDYEEVAVPLSEHEQKMLEQMERALYAEDPRFATHMKGARSRSSSRRRTILGVCAALAGLGLVIAGVTTGLIILGALGFALMVGGVAWAVTPSRPTKTALHPVGGAGRPDASAASKTSPSRSRGASRAKPTKPSGGSLVKRMEERWEKRRRQQ